MLLLNGIENTGNISIDPKHVVFVAESQHEMAAKLYLDECIDGCDILHVAHTVDNVMAMLKTA